MSHKSWLALILFLTLSTVPVFAQGEFLEREQSSVELMPMFTFGKDATSYGFSLSYCANGYLGIGFVWSKNDDMKAESYGPILAGHLLKNEYANGMLGASVYLAFDRVKFKIDDTTSIHNTYILGGAGIYYNFYMNDWITIQPSFLTTASIDLESSWEEGNKSLGDKLDFFLQLGVAFELYRDKTYHPFIASGLTIPSESSQNTYAAVGLGVMAVF